MELLAVSLDELANSPQIALSLFADVGNKENGAVGLQLGVAHDAGDGRQRREAGPVIGDARRFEPASFAAHSDIRTRRKDGIQVRGDQNEVAFRAAGALTNDVA